MLRERLLDCTGCRRVWVPADLRPRAEVSGRSRCKDLIRGQDWIMFGADRNSDAYEGLLDRVAADTRSGASQYFAPS
jgi:hypothetical protein